MTSDFTEDEMRRALFGAAMQPSDLPLPRASDETSEAKAKKKPGPILRRSNKPFTSRLKVMLRVGNIFEGETEIFTYEADTLSKLQAELEATKAARKKFRYIEVISVAAMS